MKRLWIIAALLILGTGMAISRGGYCYQSSFDFVQGFNVSRAPSDIQTASWTTDFAARWDDLWAPIPENNWKLCHGVVNLRNNDHGRVMGYGHAWCEREISGMVVDPGWDPVLKVYAKEDFYSWYAIEPSKVMCWTKAESTAMYEETGHVGPWNPEILKAQSIWKTEEQLRIDQQMLEAAQRHALKRQARKERAKALESTD